VLTAQIVFSDIVHRAVNIFIIHRAFESDYVSYIPPRFILTNSMSYSTGPSPHHDVWWREQAAHQAIHAQGIERIANLEFCPLFSVASFIDSMLARRSKTQSTSMSMK
jgi:hypothetical protein